MGSGDGAGKRSRGEVDRVALPCAVLGVGFWGSFTSGHHDQRQIRVALRPCQGDEAGRGTVGREGQQVGSGKTGRWTVEITREARPGTVVAGRQRGGGKVDCGEVRGVERLLGGWEEDQGEQRWVGKL